MLYDSTERTLPEIPDAGDAGRPLGALEVRRDGATLALPLASVEYRASVCERIADVTLTQTFENPFAEHLEAVYVFPLAGGAAVRSFELAVAGRTIRGVVKERAEARAEYRRALEAGKRAAMLEQERDNVFTVQVGNLPPGERAVVTISYSERLELFDDGRAELRLPLVVAPRYTPGAALDRENAGRGVEDDTDQVPDASRVTPPRLAAGSTAGPSVAVEVAFAGGDLADLASSQHATAVALGGGGVVVRLAKATERANRDFVLRWRFAGDRVRTSLAVYRDPSRGLFGMLTVAAPPPGEGRAAARDVLFLLDRSGSMGGLKMRSAARACEILLQSLGPADRYAIAAFDTTVEWMGGAPRFVAADETGIHAGGAYLRAVEARGGTEIALALGAAFDAIPPAADRAPIVVVLTDGEVTNESAVLDLVRRRAGATRLFAVGIDTAVNDALLKRLAATGRGTALLVEPGAELEQAMAAIAREIGVPEVVDLAVEDLDAGLLKPEQAPERFPDLFAGRAATVFLRLESFGAVRLRGQRARGGEYVEEVRAVEVDAPAIAHLWARSRVTDLEDRYRAEQGGRDALKREIVALSIAHQIVTRFTAYLAVDDAEAVNPGGAVREIVQPVDMPDEWEMHGAPPMPVMAAAPMMPSAPIAMRESAPYGGSRDVAFAYRERRMDKAEAKAPGSAGSLVGQVWSALRGQKRQQGGADKLLAALEAFARLVASAILTLEGGGRVDARPIERARADALKLAGGGASPIVERIRRYLEHDAVDAVARATAGDAVALRAAGVEVERLVADARRELETGGAASFWE